MDNQQISGHIPQTNNTDMTIIRVKYQVSRLCFPPSDLFTVAVLCGSSTTVTQYVLATGCVVKYPIGKTGTVKAKGSVCTRGGTACGSDLPELPPSAVPAKHKALATPEVIDLAHKGKCVLDYGSALRRKVGWQGAQQL